MSLDDEDETSVSDAILRLARQVQNLGNADASTHLGGLEALGMQIEKAAEIISSGLNSVAEAIESMVIGNTSEKS